MYYKFFTEHAAIMLLASLQHVRYLSLYVSYIFHFRCLTAVQMNYSTHLFEFIESPRHDIGEKNLHSVSKKYLLICIKYEFVCKNYTHEILICGHKIVKTCTKSTKSQLICSHEMLICSHKIVLTCIWNTKSQANKSVFCVNIITAIDWRKKQNCETRLDIVRETLQRPKLGNIHWTAFKALLNLLRDIWQEIRLWPMLRDLRGGSCLHYWQNWNGETEGENWGDNRLYNQK